MIYIFRKEMKKWHTVLWIVFVALTLGSGLSLFYRGKSPGEEAVGSVDGQTISLKKYNQALNKIITPYMQLYGMSKEKILSLLGKFGDLGEFAFNICVEERLLDDIQEKFKVRIDKQTFNSKLAETLPPNIFDESGKVNINSYQYYLQMLSTTPSEYEKTKKAELKRDVVLKMISNSFYLPEHELREVFEQDFISKRFTIAVFSLNYFLNGAKKDTPDDKILEDFYTQHRENYRVPDRCRAKYWEIPIEEYEKKIEIDEQSIKNFYDKNKSSLFRIPPKIKVRKIVIKKDKVTRDGENSFKFAQEVHQQVKQHPDRFAELAKQYSEDKETAKTGGIIDFFSRGKYDSNFETAAFKLKEINEISDIVMTKDGYEIIQLIERIKAVERPLESVKSEIVNSLRSKKVVTLLQGELGIMMHNAKEDIQAIDKFAKDKVLKEKEIDWVSKDDITDASLHGQLAQRLFSAKKQERTFGYFKTTGNYVIYRFLDSKKSYIPKFVDVKGVVLEDYYKDKAKQLQEKGVNQVKVEVIDSKNTLKDVATKLGLKVIETGFIKKGDKIPELDKNTSFLNGMFMLSDKAQIYQTMSKGDSYLAQMLEKKDDDVKFEDKRDEIVEKRETKESSKQVSSFIASLQRNAKIEMNKKMLGLRSRDYSEEI